MCPGDLVVDATGIIVVPTEHVARILATAVELVEREAVLAADIDAGVPVSMVLGTSYERLGRSS